MSMMSDNPLKHFWQNLTREKGTLASPYMLRYKWYHNWQLRKHGMLPKPMYHFRTYPHALWQEARRWEAIQYCARYVWHKWVKHD